VETARASADEAVTSEKSIVWTDGSCNVKGIRGRGGWAALLEEGGTVREISGGVDATTHNRMELTAICEALEMLSGAIEVRTDSTYVEKCFNQNWHESGCATALGRDRVAGSRTETCGSVCSAWCGMTLGT
jgi:ribonuclease HI